MEAIKERFQTFAKNPKYAVSFFGEKIITTWCEPTYQSIWSGPLISMNCSTTVEFLRNLYSGESVYELFASLMNILTVLLFGFSLVFVSWNILHTNSQILPLDLFSILFFLGGFLFHLFWETKSQYVYPYVVTLVPSAARGMNIFFESIQKHIHGKGAQHEHR